MNTEDAQKMHEDLKVAMSELVKSAASDEKFLNEIQKRGFWRRLFANDTRDLAKAGIRQNELIRNVQKAFQKLVCLVQDVAEQERRVCIAIDELRKSEDAVIAKIASKISDVADVACKAYFAAQKTEVIGWLGLIRTNTSLRKESEWFLFLQLVFDFLNVCRSKHVQCEVESGRYILAAFLKLGRGKSQKFTAKQFALALLDELEKYDLFEEYLKITDVVVDPLIFRKIMNDSKAESCRVLVQLAKKLCETKCVFDVLPKFLTDEKARKDCRRLVIEQSIEGMEEARSYDYVQFADELISGLLPILRGGSDAAPVEECVDCEAPVVENEVENQSVSHCDIAFALADGIAISSHAFLSTNPTEHEKKIYLTLFSLVDPACESIPASHYLRSVARLFGVELCELLHKLDAKDGELLIDEMAKVLSSPERRCAWCLDVVFVACECGCYNDDVVEVLRNFGRKFGYKNDDVRSLLEMAHVVATESDDATKLFEVVKRLSRHTDGWKSILEFRGVKLQGALGAPCVEECLKRSEISLAISKLRCDFELDEGWLFTGDEGCFRRMAIEGARLTYRDRLKALKKSAVQYELVAREALITMHQNVLRYFGCPIVVVDGSIDGICIPEDCDCHRNNWKQDMDEAFDALDVIVNKLGAAVDLGQKQIDLYERGDFSKCIIGLNGEGGVL